MPWHFGGPPVLTDAEINAYLKHYRDKKKREQAEAKKTPRPSPKRGRR